MDMASPTKEVLCGTRHCIFRRRPRLSVRATERLSAKGQTRQALGPPNSTRLLRSEHRNLGCGRFGPGSCSRFLLCTWLRLEGSCWFRNIGRVGSQIRDSDSRTKAWCSEDCWCSGVCFFVPFGVKRPSVSHHSGSVQLAHASAVL